MGVVSFPALADDEADAASACRIARNCLAQLQRQSSLETDDPRGIKLILDAALSSLELLRKIRAPGGGEDLQRLSIDELRAEWRALSDRIDAANEA